MSENQQIETTETQQTWVDENVTEHVEDIPEVAKTPPEEQVHKPIPRNEAEWATDHFTWKELTYSHTAEKNGWKNEPNAEERANLLRLADWLEQLRYLLAQKYGKEIPIRITSAYRSKRVNRAVGGSDTSAHPKGLAGDIQAIGLTIKQLAYDIYSFIKSGKLPKLDQLIREMPRGGGQWVHVGLRTGSQRGELLVYEWTARKGRNAYTKVDEFFNPALA